MDRRTSNVNKTIGANIKRIRKSLENKMTQEDLAKKLKLHRISVVNIENGKQGLTMVTLIDISKVLGVTVNKIMRNAR